MNSFEKNCHTK